MNNTTIDNQVAPLHILGKDIDPQRIEQQQLRHVIQKHFRCSSQTEQEYIDWGEHHEGPRHSDYHPNDHGHHEGPSYSEYWR